MTEATTTYAPYLRGTSVQLSRWPNIVTVSRVFITIPLVIAGSLGYAWLALALVLLATFSDWLDGFLARLCRDETPLGVVADPLADKFFMNFTLLGACYLNDTIWLLVLWCTMMCYDIDNTWQRWPAIKRALLNLPVKEKGLPVTLVSKAKTATLFLVIAYAYVPTQFVASQWLTLGAIAGLTLVALSWWNNRRRTVTAWLLG